MTVPSAEGRILEVGFGTGTNLPFYDASKVSHLFALEPSEGMRRLAKPAAENAPFDISFLDLPGEEVPLEDGAVDTVVCTFTLCSIGEWQSALGQMRRVLKPGGRLIFAEHGRAPTPRLAQWQDRLNGPWKALAGGCNMNRPIRQFVEEGGFAIDRCEAYFMNGMPPVLGYMTHGAARPR
ncbi:MAG: class I SAM-dependent methyltransferase [Pseudomonadota bacterium]